MKHAPAPAWANNIVGFDLAVDAESLLANPLNAWIHPQEQQAAMDDALAQIGWTDCVKVNTVTGHVVDGHMRVTLALRAGQPVPVLYISIPEEQEHLVLASHNTIARMALPDAAQFNSLFDEIRTDDLLDPGALSGMLDSLAANLNLTPGLPPASEEPETAPKDTEREATKHLKAILSAASALTDMPLTTPQARQLLKQLWHDPAVSALMQAARTATMEG